MAAWVAGLGAIQLKSRPRAVGLLAGAVLCAGAPFVIRAWSVREPRAVVMHEANLEGSPLSLEPGRVVIVRARAGARARVRAGRGVEGWIRADHLALPESPAT
jgi:hypothetical protein